MIFRPTPEGSTWPRVFIIHAFHLLVIFKGKKSFSKGSVFCRVLEELEQQMLQEVLTAVEVWIVRGWNFSICYLPVLTGG